MRRRRFSRQFKAEAVQMVIETGVGRRGCAFSWHAQSHSSASTCSRCGGGQPIRVPARHDHQPRRPMDHPADPQPRDGPRRSPHPVPVPRPRSGRPLRTIIRCGPGRCGHPRGADSFALLAGESFRRTVHPHGQSRAHQPYADLQSAALACGAPECVRHYNGRRPHRAHNLRPPHPSHPVADLSHERSGVVPFSVV
jgi:transposase-like protein